LQAGFKKSWLGRNDWKRRLTINCEPIVGEHFLADTMREMYLSVSGKDLVGCAMFPYKLARALIVWFAVTVAAWPQSRAVVEVWVVGSGQGKVYHCPGSRWYGVGEGRREPECQAIHEGYRPAYGSGCGSTCLQSWQGRLREPVTTCSATIPRTNGRGL